MELHHSKHHQAYVTNLNNALKTYATAIAANDVPSQIALQAAIKFNGGGHINHSLFWENLTPSSSPDADSASAPALTAEIAKTWGSLEKFQEAMVKALLGIQGSGWGWLVKDGNALRIITTKDQDPVVGGEVPIFGIDMWEHAYYLQVGLFIASSLLIRVLFAHFMIFSILMARLHTSRISGRSSTGRLLSSASRETERTLSRSSRPRCRDDMNE
jgi:superoxide dismutase